MSLFLLFSLIWGFCLTLIPNNIEIKTKDVVLLLGTLLIYWGFSYANTPDTEGYMDFFYMISDRGWVLDSLYGSSAGTMEPGVFILMQLCKRVSGSYYFFQFVILTFDVVLTYWGLRKMTNSNNQAIVFFLLFTFTLHFYLSALRQGVAIAIMVFCMPFFRDNKFYIYIPLIVLAIFFHQSAILLFAIPILMMLIRKTKIKWDSMQFLFVAVFAICNICYLLGISAGGFLERFLGNYVYDSSFSTSRTLSISEIETSNFGILKMVEIDVCYVLFFFSKLVKKDDILRFFGVMFLVYFIINSLVGGIVVHRLTYYLRIPYYFVLFESLRAFFVKGLNANYKLSNLVLYIYMFTLFMMQTIIGRNYIFDYYLFELI